MVAPVGIVAGAAARKLRCGARKGNASPRRSGVRGQTTTSCVLEKAVLVAVPACPKVLIDDEPVVLDVTATAEIAAAPEAVAELRCYPGDAKEVPRHCQEDGVHKAEVATRGTHVSPPMNALPLNEHLDQESRAAAAAAALLRRLAKVGPETTPEEAVVAWVNTSTRAGPDRSRRRLNPLITAGEEEDEERSTAASHTKGVWFDLRASTTHEVVPYSEIYGRHPREFVFGREAEMLPAGDRYGFTGLQDDTSTSAPDDDESNDLEFDAEADFEEPSQPVLEEAHIEDTFEQRFEASVPIVTATG